MDDTFVYDQTGKVVQAFRVDKELECRNPHCKAKIPPNERHTRHAYHWYAPPWKHINNQPYCTTCFPVYDTVAE